MTGQDFSDETLMAFADGELGPEEHAAVELAMETDEALAGRVAEFLDSRMAAQKALKPLLDEPVPDALMANVQAMVAQQQDEGANVANFRANQPASRTAAPRWALPMAASIALVAGALGGYFVGLSNAPEPSHLQMADMSQPGIVKALNTIVSGKETALDAGGRFKAIATYKDDQGDLCREFEVDRTDRSTIVSVACRHEKTWKVQFTVVAGQNSAGYAPASSHESLNAYLTAVGASEPMSVEEENSALKALD